MSSRAPHSLACFAGGLLVSAACFSFALVTLYNKFGSQCNINLCCATFDLLHKNTIYEKNILVCFIHLHLLTFLL